MADSKTPIIQAKNIHLAFGSYDVLTDVSVDFHEGELVGLVGDNGAGKTSLIKIICGINTPTKGALYFDGKKVEQFNPKFAIDMGIETIQQSVGLCDNLSIARNFYLGREPTKKRFGIPFIDFAKLHESSRRVIKDFGLREDVTPDDEVALLSGGERQSIKIGRSVEFKNRVVIMDEPTNHLSVREREHVNNLALQLRDQGLLVIYITHDIFQVHRLADRIVIMENGEVVHDQPKEGGVTAEELEAIIRSGGRTPAEAAGA